MPNDIGKIFSAFVNEAFMHFNGMHVFELPTNITKSDLISFG